MCLSRFILFFLSFFSFLVLAFSLSLFHLPFYLTVPLYVLSLRWSWPWTWSSLSWACKMCKAKICRRKSFYNQIIMKNKGIWAHNFSRKEKKYSVVYNSSPFRLSSFCVVILVICLQVPRYICYLIKTARKRKKKEKLLPIFSVVGVSVPSLGACGW